ncbi:hypothetical protein [Salinicola peritrichatus]|uniref:hypothetical protein n=1 Tax=Salinicola peritrichatus TaxID=1267424 RepID=UPI0013A63396|nr:hypothetical protein [Salinicola peritrichatus]
MKNNIYLASKIAIYILGTIVFLNLLGFMKSVLLGLMVAAGTAWIQHRGWKNQEETKALDNEKKKAYELIDEISRTVGARIYHQTSLAQALRTKDAPHDREAYKSSVKEMNEKYHSICLGLKYSFGSESALSYEALFQNRLAKNNSSISSSASHFSPKNLDNAINELKTINWDLHQFCNHLLNRIRSNEFSKFTEKSPRIDYANREKLSATYLALRLLNIRK